MRNRAKVLAVLGALLMGSGIVAGCGGPIEGDLPKNKLSTQEESDRVAAQVKKGMIESGYKGAPGKPAPK
ncbi:MAG: hypothetical protein U0794_06690 [Isosphaeraceae bacterium]